MSCYIVLLLLHAVNVTAGELVVYFHQHNAAGSFQWKSDCSSTQIKPVVALLTLIPLRMNCKPWL
jgi:hypothetical protein